MILLIPLTKTSTTNTTTATTTDKPTTTTYSLRRNMTPKLQLSTRRS